MPNLAEQLKRDGHLLAKSPRPKKQPKRIPAMSPKRKRDAALYSKKRKAFLEAHPYCQARETILDYFYRTNDLAGFMSAPKGGVWLAEEIHHREKRGKNYLNESTWLAVSKWSHRFIEDNKSTARKLGLLCY